MKNLLLGALFLNFFLSPLLLLSEPLPYKPVELANSWSYRTIGDKLFFAGYQRDAEDNIVDIGIWESDGTEEGTVSISDDILSYANSIMLADGKIANRVFFVADVGNDGDNELYFADQIQRQHALIGKFNDIKLSRTIYTQKVYNNNLYFLKSDLTYGQELWYSNGEAGNYQLLKDICPGNCSSAVPEMIEYNGLLYFAADNEVNDFELWVSDGTETGTTLLKNIYDDSSPPAKGDYVTAGAPYDFTIVGSRLLFTANDGIHGRELWVSDGSAAGTKMLMDLTPGDDNGDPYDSNPGEFHVANGKLYFKTTNETGEQTVWDIWETDGTEAGTRKLYTYSTDSSAFGAPAEFAVMDNKLFFQMFDPIYGYEVFWVDLTGIVPGAQLLKDIFPGTGEYDIPNGSDPWHLRVVSGLSVGLQDRLYFRAQDPVLGTEIFVSDGTREGTRVLKDISPGSANSDLDEFHVIGHKLFFREDVLNLWVIDLTKEEGAIPDGQDKSAPKIAVRTPKTGAFLKSRFTMKGTARDDQGIESIQCFYSGLKDWVDAVRTKTVQRAAGQIVSWKCGVKINKRTKKKLLRRNGRMSVRVRASDFAGNTTSLNRGVFLEK